MKKPIIAALLNIIPGVGYLYLGVRKPFAFIVLLSSLSSLLVDFQHVDLWIFVSSAILQIGFMVDAFLLAKEKTEACVKLLRMSKPVHWLLLLGLSLLEAVLAYLCFVAGPPIAFFGLILVCAPTVQLVWAIIATFHFAAKRKVK